MDKGQKLEYWKEFCDYAKKNPKYAKFTGQSPKPQNYYDVALGSSLAHTTVAIAERPVKGNHNLQVKIYFTGMNRLKISAFSVSEEFDKHKEVFQNKVGNYVYDKNVKKQPTFNFSIAENLNDKSSWPKYFEWQLSKLYTLQETIIGLDKDYNILKNSNYTGYSSDDIEKDDEDEEETNTHWIIMANPKYYDHIAAFKQKGSIAWSRKKNLKNVSKGDIVFIYNTKSKSIDSKCIVTEEHLDPSVWHDDDKFWNTDPEPLEDPFLVKILGFSDSPELNREALKQYGFKSTQVGMKLKQKLADYIDNFFKSNNYDDNDFLSEVYLSKEDLESMKDALIIKKNLILKGAPGVGKTFASKRLAYAMMGCKDKDRIEFVQFHQNYSYEEFVCGYKPDGSGFRLEEGVFYKFCIKAKNDPERPYFFIIDEINRGNISKIFGELLMGIENNYRGKEEIKLPYNINPLVVPDNLYIIGMMNTADRSIAMIDYALRRRFSFFDMHPGFETQQFMEYASSIDNPHFESLVKKIKDVNKVIKNDPSLGDGFCIGHSYVCKSKKNEIFDDKRLKEIIKLDIIPTLKEYWFDNEKMREEWVKAFEDVIPESE